MPRRRTGLAVALMAGLWMGSAAAAAPAAMPPSSPSEAPLAEVNGAAITENDLDPTLAGQVTQLERQIYALRARALDDAITRRLLELEAGRQGVSVAALLEREVNARMSPPTEAEVTAAFDLRRDEVPQEEQAELRASIRDYLTAQKRADARGRYLRELRAAARIAIHLPEPRATRIPVVIEGEPSLGPATAVITLVEFGDFQCPYCRQAQPTIKALLKEYAGKIRLVYRDFPLPDVHPDAQRAAEAARCAGEQNRFWEYHDALYADPGRQKDDDLVAHATRLGLDASRFRACLAERRYRAAVDRGVADGRRIGITATPTFFVNGIPVLGAQPIAEFRRVIDRELAALAAGRRSRP